MKIGHPPPYFNMLLAAQGVKNVHHSVDNAFNDAFSDEGVARGEDALTILDNTNTRNTFINELLEVMRREKLHYILHR